jgi:hypothetical protein
LIARLVWSQLHFGSRQSPIEITPADYRPPLVEKDFDRPPIRDPREDEQALFDDLAKRTSLQLGRHGLTRDDGKEEDREADNKRSASDAEELLQLKPDYLGAINKKLPNRGTDLLGLGQSYLA